MPSAKRSDKLILAVIIAAGVFAALYSVVQMSGPDRSRVPQEYVYDIQARIDPNLVLYEQVGPAIPVDLGEPRGIFVDTNGLIYVVGDRMVCYMDSNGNTIDRFTTAGQPHALAVGQEGLVYVAAGDHVEVYDRSGSNLASWSSPAQGAILTAIAADGRSIFAADAANRVVYRYDRQGRLLGELGRKDPQRGIEGLVVPSPHLDLITCRDGLLRVTNPGRHRIEAYTPDGDLEQSWGRFGSDIEGFTGCCNPISIAQLPDGAMVTAEKGLVRAKVFALDGRFLGVVAGPVELGHPEGKVCQTTEQCQGRGLDLATDAEGRIYVLDTERKSIRIFRQRPGV